MPKKKVPEAAEETVQAPVPTEPAPTSVPRRQSSEDLLAVSYTHLTLPTNSRV